MARLKSLKIGVLAGGPSSEREISLSSGKAVFKAFSDRGYNVVFIDITTEDCKEQIRASGAKAVFIAMHGRFGEDGQIQSLLDEMGIAYTGSKTAASKLAMDKIESRAIFEKKNIPVPKYKIFRKENSSSLDGIGPPLVVKPSHEGSSIGLSVVTHMSELEQAMERAFSYDDDILIEEYIKGREITVGILNDEPLPVIEIVPKKGLYDYESKYTTGLTEYLIPAPIDPDFYNRAQELGLAAHKALGCRYFSRVDMRLDNKLGPIVLEVNTIPGLTATSLLPKAAAACGIDFATLCEKIMESAL